MNYCLRYRKDSKYMEDADELMFVMKSNTESPFIHFRNNVQRYSAQRLVVIIEDVDSFLKWNTASVVNYLVNDLGMNIAVCFDHYEERLADTISDMKAEGLDFFFATRVADWSTLIGLMDMGVSDVYIVEDLGFQLAEIAPITEKAEVNVRVFANVCQTPWARGDRMKSFFIRPEDVDTYSQWVDVIEFFGDVSREDVYYRIYAIDKRWFGDLREIIMGMNFSLDSRYIVPQFGEVRGKCGLKCLRGARCRICDETLKTTENIRKLYEATE